MNKEQAIAQIAEKHKIPEGDVEEIFEDKLAETEEAGFSGSQAVERALKRTFMTFKRKSMDNTEGVEGVILGAGDRYDAVGYSRSEALEAYEENPQGAIKDKKVAVAVPPGEESNIVGNGVDVIGQVSGWNIVAHPSLEQLMGYDFAERGTAEVDDADTEIEDGWRVYPLDDRKRYNSGAENQGYGMPIDKHSWTRRCIGVFIRDGSDEAMIGQVTLRDQQSLQNPPVGEAVQFKARVDEADDEELLYINSTNETEFNPNPELEEELPSIDTLIEKYFPQGEWLFDLDGLYEHLESQQRGDTVIVKCDVADMNLEPNSNDTLRMVVSQLSFQGGDMIEREALCWIPAWQKSLIDFAVESSIYVIGRARLQDAYDPVKQERTPEKQEAVINVQGVFADPVHRIPREDADELGEEDVDFSTEEEDVEFNASEW